MNVRHLVLAGCLVAACLSSSFAQSISDDIAQARAILNRTGRTGKWFKANAEARADDWEAAAEDSAEAKWLLGRCYLDGLAGRPLDRAKALELFRAAADGGFSLGFNELGHAYKNGLGVGKDLDEAAKWYLKCAEAGEGVGCYNVAESFAQKMDIDQAREWFIKAGDVGYQPAMKLVINIYQYGTGGVPVSPTEAVKWYAKLADAGDLKALAKLVLYCEKTDFPDHKEEAERYRELLTKRAGVHAENYLRLADILNAPPIGKKVPNIKIVAGDKQIQLEDSRDKVVLLRFMASWCIHCKNMQPDLEALAEKYGPDFTVVDVDIDANPRLAELWEVESVPFCYVIKKDGTVGSWGNLKGQWLKDEVGEQFGEK